MRYIKGNMVIESWGAYSVLEAMGYKSEESIRSDHQKEINRQKLIDWVERNRCTVCGRSGRACVCPAE